MIKRATRNNSPGPDPVKYVQNPTDYSEIIIKPLIFSGYGEGYTEIVMKGRYEDKKFLALYIK